MWQDALVTLIALFAVAVLGRRWLRARGATSGSCPSCASGAACAKPPRPKTRAEEGMGRERVGPGGGYQF